MTQYMLDVDEINASLLEARRKGMPQIVEVQMRSFSTVSRFSTGGFLRHQFDKNSSQAAPKIGGNAMTKRDTCIEFSLQFEVKGETRKLC